MDTSKLIGANVILVRSRTDATRAALAVGGPGVGIAKLETFRPDSLAQAITTLSRTGCDTALIVDAGDEAFWPRAKEATKDLTRRMPLVIFYGADAKTRGAITAGADEVRSPGAGLYPVVVDADG